MEILRTTVTPCQRSIHWNVVDLMCQFLRSVVMTECYARILFRSPWLHNLHGHIPVVSWVHCGHSWEESNSWIWSHRRKPKGLSLLIGGRTVLVTTWTEYEGSRNEKRRHFLSFGKEKRINYILKKHSGCNLKITTWTTTYCNQTTDTHQNQNKKYFISK